jgi:hypothetical protein
MRPSKQSRRVDSPKKLWKSDEYLGLKPSLIDWARLAAYVDGEGSINLTPRRTDRAKSMTYCARVVVTNTDFRLTKWCMDTFGVPYYEKSFKWGGSHAANWKSCFFAQASGYRACWILRNCLPFFIMKREQAEVVLQHQETLNPDVFNRGGGVTTPQDILEYRLRLKKKLAQLNKRGPEEGSDVTKKVMEA